MEGADVEEETAPMEREGLVQGSNRSRNGRERPSITLASYRVGRGVRAESPWAVGGASHVN